MLSTSAAALAVRQHVFISDMHPRPATTKQLSLVPNCDNMPKAPLSPLWDSAALAPGADTLLTSDHISMT